MTASLEHVNVTVSDAEKTAAMLCDLFDWTIRWRGPSMLGGRSVHVGTESLYVAVYQPPEEEGVAARRARGGLNHIGVLVDDLDGVERRVRKAGMETFNHADYEPGRRFYFLDHDGIEFEVVSYAPR